MSISLSKSQHVNDSVKKSAEQTTSNDDCHWSGKLPAKL